MGAHGILGGTPWEQPWSRPWFTMEYAMDGANYHVMLHGTYRLSMDGTMVQSMDEWSSMA